MAATDVVVRFIADTSQLRSAEGDVTSLGSKIKSMGGKLLAGVGAIAVVDQLKEATSAAAEYGDSIAATQVIFGDAGNAALRWAEQNANAFLMSKQQAVDGVNTFATFGKAAGLSGKDLVGFSTNLTGLAGDLASFRGGTTAEAIEAIGAALRGETEPIRKYGVMLDDATLRARAMSMGIYDGIGPLTAQQKTLAAQAEILAQTTDAQGDAARTADSAANQQRKMEAAFKDTQVAIGTALLPVMQALLPIITATAKFIQKNASVLVPLAGIIAAVTIAQWAWNAAMAANPIGLIVIGIAALIAAVVLIISNFDKVKEVAGQVWEFVLNAIQTVWTWIKDNWPLLLAILTGPFGVAVLLVVKNFDTIKDAASSVIEWLKSNWPVILAVLSGPFGIAVLLIVRNFDTIKDTARGVVDWIGDQFHRVIDLITAPFGFAFDIVRGWIADIKTTISSIPGAFTSAIDIVKGVWNGFARAWNGIRLHIPSVDLPLVGTIGGGTVDLPNLPILDAGGIVTRPTLAFLAANRRPEAVVPLSRAGGGFGTSVVYNVNVRVEAGTDPAQTGRSIVRLIQEYERANGAHWRAP